uniref:TauD/TfdA-like domain-containing protein n=1 Tax=viral metagenome TaxID=1070528 RepID=A0A6C0DD55_9ZZZZ
MVEITEDELDILKNLVKKITDSPSKNPDDFCNQTKILSKELPIRIQIELTNFVENGNENGFLLVSGLDLLDDNIPDTPSENTKKIGEKTILAKIQAIILSFVSDIIAYEAEGYGNIFQDIVPIQKMKMEQTSLSSGAELEIHTEQAFSKLRPDLLSLACLRGDPNAITYVLPAESIIDNLSDSDVELLKQPLWKTGVDLSFKLDGHEFIEGDIRGPSPILDQVYRSNGRHNLVFDQDLMFGINDDAERLIMKIVDIYYQHRISHNLKPGEIIIIDNRYAVHGRSPFQPKYDGKDRFLVRCFSVFDYNNSSYARGNDSRTVSAIYS